MRRLPTPAALRARVGRWAAPRAGRPSGVDERDDLDDAGFVTHAYHEVLGREPDDDGLATHVAALRAGASRADVVLVLARSPEAQARAARDARPLRDLPDLRAERPDRYGVAPSGHTTFTATGEDDLDWLEGRIHDVGYYDGGGVWSGEVDPDKQRMAEVVVGLPVAPHGARRVLELGCYTGALLTAMAARGCDVAGVELSAAAVEQAPPELRDRIVVGDVVRDLPDGPFDVVVGLDVFEHVSPRRLVPLLEAVAARVAPGGRVLANIPAFGDDDVFGCVFPRYLPSWEGDAAAGRPFRELDCDELGYPRNGHLVWAESTWWEGAFAAAGLQRDRDVERALQEAHGRWWAAHVPARRSMYVFRHA